MLYIFISIIKNLIFVDSLLFFIIELISTPDIVASIRFIMDKFYAFSYGMYIILLLLRVSLATSNETFLTTIGRIYLSIKTSITLESSLKQGYSFSY
jgi:hypothetical protein